MINKEFHYALGFTIFVSLFMWFHVISHQNITNMHVVHYLAKLVQKNVSIFKKLVKSYIGWPGLFGELF